MNRRSTTTIVQPPSADAPRDDVLPQPNDRDESSTDAARKTELAPEQHAQMAQAARDLASGQQDTDCRASPRAAGSACPPSPQARPGVAGDHGAEGSPDFDARDTENRQTARHDPGRPGSAPDGTPRR